MFRSTALIKTTSTCTCTCIGPTNKCTAAITCSTCTCTCRYCLSLEGKLLKTQLSIAFNVQ